MPECLRASSSTDKGKIKSAEPIKIEIDHSKPLPKLSQYSIRPESTEGLLPTTEDLTKQGLRIPSTTPCMALLLPIKKPNGQGWRYVQDLRAIKIVILRFPVVPNLSTLSSNVKWITVVDLRSAFFGIPADSENQY